MGDSHLAVMIAGAFAVGYLTISAFFLRFWKTTRDGLFLAFAVAFLLMAFGQGATGAFGLTGDEMAPVYLLRLTAFGLIIIAIVRKNFVDRPSR